MPKLEVSQVRKTFEGGKTILDGVSFEAGDGEFVSLLGASGCGKTTLLRIIAGLETADEGKLSIEGRDVAKLSPKERDIAMVFQSYALYPHLEVFDNIAMGLRLRKTPEPEIASRVNEAAGMLGLAELLKRKPSALSGGQRQRVALARALVRHPKLYLLDEPLSNLDAVLRDKTRAELKLLFKRVNGTVIYVTHDQVEAMTLSDRIVVMDKGRIQQVGSPHEIYHKPANVFVATFLGAPPMNVFPIAKAKELGVARAGDLLCGIRPEDLRVHRSEKPGAKPAALALAEPTGASTILTLETAGMSLRAVVPGTFEPGETWIELPADKLHFFDAKTLARA
jgi:ABC-type sugar transport system ATPase subunit